LWLVAVANALNFLDVCDGLAASIAFINLLCWGWFVQSSSSVIYLAVAGACVGFLWWNKPPARIYLGDCGSLSLGFLLAVAALQGALVLPPTRIRPFTPILFTAVPLFELAFITTVRLQKGLPWWRGSPDHFSLRLQQAGWKKYQIDLGAVCASAAMWASGWIIGSAPPHYAVLLLALLVTLAGICWRILLQWEPSPPGADELPDHSEVKGLK
jgi:UDP-GlcNAc:undecaprenyl-phosphate GlcNAc-1-phosphate transferase